MAMLAGPAPDLERSRAGGTHPLAADTGLSVGCRTGQANTGAAPSLGQYES